MIRFVLFITFTIFSKVMLDKSEHTFSIFTDGCVIPNFPLISENIKSLISPPSNVSCSKSFQILRSNKSYIWVKDEAFSFYNIDLTEFYCCYTNFSANSANDISYGNCIQFSKVIKVQNEFVQVECYHWDNKIHVEYFVFPSFRTFIAKPKDKAKFNILLFGLESVSRMNFLRSMPMTAQFLQERDSVQLFGYNKVGDNSLPNLLPLLTGQSIDDFEDCLHGTNTVKSNNCTYVWETFKTAGYITALASDSPAGLLDTHEYNFHKIPTDYYLLPFMYETRKLFSNQYFNYHLCAGNKFYYKILVNYICDLVEKLKDYNLFGIFWEESVSHEYNNYPPIMDLDYTALLLKLENNGYLEESVIIFFSDHGIRWGDIVRTEQGRLEERLPLMEILFPRKFKTLYKLAYQNFNINSRRLTTPYDIYNTLMDLLNPTSLSDDTIVTRSKRQAHLSSSLFLPVQRNRTCASVGISEHWCTCYRGKILQAGRKSRILAAQHLISYINNLLQKFPQCRKLSVEKILDVSVSTDSQGSTYKVVIQSSPGGGIFDSTLRRERGLWAVSGTVSRLNLYRNQSSCLSNEVIKMYCYCKRQ